MQMFCFQWSGGACSVQVLVVRGCLLGAGACFKWSGVLARCGYRLLRVTIQDACWVRATALLDQELRVWRVRSGLPLLDGIGSKRQQTKQMLDQC